MFGNLRSEFVDKVADLPLEAELLLEKVVLDVHQSHLHLRVYVVPVLTAAVLGMRGGRVVHCHLSGRVVKV